MVKFEGQGDGLLILLFAVDLADAHRGALVRRFDEQRQAQLRLHFGKAHLMTVGAGQGNKRRNRQPGIAQQTLGHVFVHAGGGAEDVGADEGQVSHPQHTLQRTIFPKGAVNNRENDVDGRQRLAAIGVNQLLRFASGNLRRVISDGRRAIWAGSCGLSR